MPFDPARLIVALLRGWYWLPLAGLALGGPLGLLGYFKFQTGYSVQIQLIRREVGTTIRASQFGDAFKPRTVSVATIVSLMQSPKLLERVGSAATPPIAGTALMGQLTIKPEKDTDLINVTLKTKSSPAATANLINLYAKEVSQLTAQMQSDEAAELDKFLRDQIAKTDLELENVNKELLDFRRENEFFGEDRQLEAYLRQLGDAEAQLESAKTESETDEFRIASIQRELARQNPIFGQLNQARNELANLRQSLTDDNPTVKEQLEKVAGLEKQAQAAAAEGTNGTANFQFSDSNATANDLYLQYVGLNDRRAGLAKQITQLTDFRDKVQEKLKTLPEKGQHFAQIVTHQQSLQATRDLLIGRQREAQVYEDSPPGLYHAFANANEDSVEESNRWKKIIMVAVGGAIFGVLLALGGLAGLELMNLRVVSAGDLRRATGVPVSVRVPDLEELDEARLAQWRFRVWAQLSRQLQLQNEPHPILAFASARVGEGKSMLIGHLADAATDRRQSAVTVTNSPGPAGKRRSLPLAEALAAPETVTRHLREHPGRPLELVFDAAWRWDLENRARWQRAVEAWQSAPPFVLLVELPALSDLDAVLEAEQMSLVIWITASGGLQQQELAQTLEMVEAAEINLAAAVLNREPALFSKLPFLDKFGLMLVLVGALALGRADAGTVTNAPPMDALSFSSQVPRLAPWQDRLVIGPGDSFNFYIYGKAGTIRNDVTVAVDGRLSYLEAQSVPVAGLTVDEMRARLDAALARYYHDPHTVAMPVTWRSKRYCILGAVMDKGIYILDRPLTIIEAVARARGIATGLYEHNTVELADMPRAFLIRQGRRAPVDFDRLFNHGDLSQNILIEPGDYLYFPSGTVNEVYLLGAVGSPGPLGLTAETTMIGVLTVRGGFRPNAFRQRVLVVRGSLEHPQTFPVNVAAILAGKDKDFQLLPGDIIYVADKPWQRTEELLQMALGSFVQTMTATWAGNNIGPFITQPLVPHL
jgi:protein involved in polysaccharide export with SLBB domain/uncharacterized protein involved in exopolysaccharide biosynthesis